MIVVKVRQNNGRFTWRRTYSRLCCLAAINLHNWDRLFSMRYNPRLKNQLNI